MTDSRKAIRHLERLEREARRRSGRVGFREKFIMDFMDSVDDKYISNPVSEKDKKFNAELDTVMEEMKKKLEKIRKRG